MTGETETNMTTEADNDDLRAQVALLRSSLVSVRAIVEDCCAVIEAPQAYDDAQRGSIVEVLRVMLSHMEDLLERVPVDPGLRPAFENAEE